VTQTNARPLASTSTYSVATICKISYKCLALPVPNAGGFEI